MAYEAKILADSISPAGIRLTTMQITYPRFVHSELMTHRVFSRNSASSRAIPIEKMIEAVQRDPVLPVWWGKNQPGMQAKEELEGDPRLRAEIGWLNHRNFAVEMAKTLHNLGLHKQIVNRLLEPWMWITVIVSSTEWDNFFKLRCHPDAQPEIRVIAEMMRELYASSTPQELYFGKWHLPLWDGDPEDVLDLSQNFYVVHKDDKGVIELPAPVLISVGRCARVSYLTHEGKRDPQADIQLAMRLSTSGHWSPFEHAATVLYEGFGYEHAPSTKFLGNFRGWKQARKFFPNESGT